MSMHTERPHRVGVWFRYAPDDSQLDCDVSDFSLVVPYTADCTFAMLLDGLNYRLNTLCRGLERADHHVKLTKVRFPLCPRSCGGGDGDSGRGLEAPDAGPDAGDGGGAAAAGAGVRGGAFAHDDNREPSDAAAWPLDALCSTAAMLEAEGRSGDAAVVADKQDDDDARFTFTVSGEPRAAEGSQSATQSAVASDADGDDGGDPALAASVVVTHVHAAGGGDDAFPTGRDDDDAAAARVVEEFEVVLDADDDDDDDERGCGDDGDDEAGGRRQGGAKAASSSASRRRAGRAFDAAEVLIVPATQQSKQQRAVASRTASISPASARDGSSGCDRHDGGVGGAVFDATDAAAELANHVGPDESLAACGAALRHALRQLVVDLLAEQTVAASAGGGAPKALDGAANAFPCLEVDFGFFAGAAALSVDVARCRDHMIVARSAAAAAVAGEALPETQLTQDGALPREMGGAASAGRATFIGSYDELLPDGSRAGRLRRVQIKADAQVSAVIGDIVRGERRDVCRLLEATGEFALSPLERFVDVVPAPAAGGRILHFVVEFDESEDRSGRSVSPLTRAFIM
jgi:hypothetical protein